MRVLLLSTYELGHQPLHVASPAAALRRVGHDLRCLDLSVEPWDLEALEWAEGRRLLGADAHGHAPGDAGGGGGAPGSPELPICLYGLYAPVSRDLTVGVLADRVIAGEYEPGLVAWVDSLAQGGQASAGPGEPLVQLGRAPRGGR
jgi:hypothetical protein